MPCIGGHKYLMNKEQILLLICGVAVFICGGIYIKDRLRLNATTSDIATDINCTVVTGIRLDEKIPEYRHLVIPDKDYINNMGQFVTITEIGENAFFGNTYLETVYIPASITYIRKNAFRNCTAIYEVSYEGSEEQWKQIKIEAGNDIFQYVSIRFNAKKPAVGD